MGASRKLQGEIDRVLKKVQEGVDVFDSIWNKVYDTENVNQKEKFEADLKKEIKKLQRYRDQIKTWIQSSEIKDKKVSASYEQALMDARKQIEREMERFKICEKETKTKAFSKEGLGQQPKTDPKEKAKSETRDWLNNVVGDLETQVESFEAEIEAVSVKKGKTRPPRLTHLETSILRHKSHIMKLELILRLLDNDELSPEEVNDVKDFLDDYVERNQDDPDDFCDVEEFYNSLPLEKVESLEDLVASGSSSLAKGVGSFSSNSTGLCLKGTIASSTPGSVAPAPPLQQINAVEDQSDEIVLLESNSDIAKAIPKSGTNGSLISSSSIIVSGTTGGITSGSSSNVTPRNLVGESVAATTVSGPSAVRSVLENPAAAALSSLNPSSSIKNDDSSSFQSRRVSPVPSEIAIGRGTVRGSVVGVTPSQESVSISMSLGSVNTAPDMVKRNMLGSDDRTESGSLTPSLASPLINRVLLQPSSKPNEAIVSGDTTNVSDGSVIGGRVFPPSGVGGSQWKPPSLNSFQNSNEVGHIRGRTEIAPDQREKFLQRYHEVQQQGTAHLSGANQKQFMAQQNSLLQQLNPQSSSTQGVGLGVQSPILANIKPASQHQQPNVVHLQSTQQIQKGSSTNGPNDTELSTVKPDGQQQSEDFNVEPLTSSGLNKAVNSDDNLKSPYMVTGSTSVTESSQLPRDTDLSPGQPLQVMPPSANLGVIGRRSISELGTIGDNINASVGSSGSMHDNTYNSQMLQAAFYKLPQPKDSERIKYYTPKHPAVTPPSYPQVQAPIVDNPAFWERLGLDNLGTDTLFFAFYYQQNTYQQYLAAKELKRQSWRYHRKYNTWFQRHEEPKITTDDYEKGTYVYFDFHIADDNLQHGWCQRIKTEFTFEYNYLEDELVV